MADMVSERYALSLYEVAQDEKQEKLYPRSADRGVRGV